MDTVLVAVGSALIFAICGRAYLNRLCAFLLGAVGGAMGAGIWHNVTGAAIGFLIGAVIAIAPPYRKPIKETSVGA